MGIDLRRCAEAAVHAALAEAFVRPEPKRSRRGRRRRPRPLHAVIRAVRTLLLALGLLTTVRAARDPKLRAELLDAVAKRFPVEELLDEIALEVEAARAAMSDEPAAGQQPDSSDDEPATQASGQPRRRPVSRRRGDTNGQRRNPPDRGKRAA
jgi:hypothetical protein